MEICYRTRKENRGQTDQPRPEKPITEAPLIAVPIEWRGSGPIMIIKITLCALLPTKKPFFGVHI